MNKEKEKFLDLGSIILLKNSTKSLIIVGYKSSNNKDYIGVTYPEGILKFDEVYSFNHDDINKLLFKGFHSPIAENFLKNLPEHNLNNKYSRIQLINKNDHNYILPIGTVIFLKKTVLTHIIIGYIEKDNEINYIGVSYPVGVEYAKNMIVFNNNDIDTIRFIGYKDQNYNEFIKFLKKEENSYKF